MSDARFEDGEDRPLRLIARAPDDLQVIASVVQDAVLPVSDMGLERRQRRFALLVSRFRWEDRAASESAGRAYERVRSLLVFDHVLGVRSQGVERKEGQVVSILEIGFVALAEGAGLVRLILAGGGVVELSVEALEVMLTDVARPHRAVSGKKPDHG